MHFQLEVHCQNLAGLYMRQINIDHYVGTKKSWAASSDDNEFIALLISTN